MNGEIIVKEETDKSECKVTIEWRHNIMCHKET
jgi:hypothetical protein